MMNEGKKEERNKRMRPEYQIVLFDIPFLSYLTSIFSFPLLSHFDIRCSFPSLLVQYSLFVIDIRHSFASTYFDIHHSLSIFDILSLPSFSIFIICYRYTLFFPSLFFDIHIFIDIRHSFPSLLSIHHLLSIFVILSLPSYLDIHHSLSIFDILSLPSYFDIHHSLSIFDILSLPSFFDIHHSLSIFDILSLPSYLDIHHSLSIFVILSLPSYLDIHHSLSIFDILSGLRGAYEQRFTKRPLLHS